MTPAFKSTRSCAAFGLLVLLLLLLPLLLPNGEEARKRMYADASDTTGDWSYMRHEIFDEKTPVDILFVGNSMLWAAIDGPLMQEQLSQSLGRPAVVAVCGTKWSGADLTYMIVRDFLAHRRVGMIVTSMPTSWQDNNEPHIQSYRWLAAGDAEMMYGNGPAAQAVKYGELVLGAPRRLEGLLVPARPSDASIEHATWCFTQAVSDRIEPICTLMPPQAVCATNSQSVKFTQQVLPPYQQHYFESLRNLLIQKSIPLTVIHIPWKSEAREATAEERFNWVEFFGKQSALLAMAPSQLFHGVSDQQLERIYYDDGCNCVHFSGTGRNFFSNAIAPPIIEEFKRHANHS